MIKSKTLLSGIGDNKAIKKYYDNWSNDYDKTLNLWNYKAPINTANVLKENTKLIPKKILDLACGTGLFAQEIIKIYPKSIIDGCDISKKILIQAKKKNIYRKLFHTNFEQRINLSTKYDLVSCIGALTYVKDHLNFLFNVSKLTNSSGYFVFTHRYDLWKNQQFQKILKYQSEIWKVIFTSKPLLYLPKNKDFTNKIKIKIILLKKI